MKVRNCLMYTKGYQVDIMEIKEIKDLNGKTEYNELAKNYGNIFNTVDWLNLFGDKVKFFGIYEGNKSLIGGFSLYEERRFGLKIYRNPPYTPCIGPFLRISAKNPVEIMSKQKKCISFMADTIDKLPYSIITASLNKDIIDTQPFTWKKFKVMPCFTYVLDLDKPIEEIWKNMSAERRNNINKGIKNGLQVKQIQGYDIVKSLVLKTFLRQGKENKVNKYYLNKILFEFANNTNSFAYATFKDGVPIATSFYVYDRNFAYYLLGGYDYEKKHHSAGTLSIWESIKHTQNLGLKYFDFEGSIVPQIEAYFRGFNGKLTPYYRINKAKLPLEILLKFIKREMF